jgi:pimeloyl-ACP methyl ester carboxylesterase
MREERRMERIEVGGASLETFAAGSGRPLLYLHGEDYFEQTKPFLAQLARKFRVIAPRHPGFGQSPRGEFRNVDDLAYLYLDLIEKLELKDVVLVGSSFGGWVALEAAVRSCERLGRLVLIGASGVKFGDREHRDFQDIFGSSDEAIRNWLFADPARWVPDYSKLPPEAMESLVRDRQTTAFYCWRPYMHNPTLKRWLHRVRVPSLVLWGEKDGFASMEHGKRLAAALPDAVLRAIRNAGHYPQIEQLDETVGAVESFIRA